MYVSRRRAEKANETRWPLLFDLAPAWCQVAKPGVIATSSLPAPRAARIPS